MGCMKKGAHEGKAYTERKEDSDSQCVLQNVQNEEEMDGKKNGNNKHYMKR